jgi:hypothetical protein
VQCARLGVWERYVPSHAGERAHEHLHINRMRRGLSNHGSAAKPSLVMERSEMYLFLLASPLQVPARSGQGLSTGPSVTRFKARLGTKLYVARHSFRSFLDEKKH